MGNKCILQILEILGIHPNSLNKQHIANHCYGNNTKHTYRKYGNYSAKINVRKFEKTVWKQITYVNDLYQNMDRCLKKMYKTDKCGKYTFETSSCGKCTVNLLY